MKRSVLATAIGSLSLAFTAIAAPASADDKDSKRGAYEYARGCMVASLIMENAEVKPSSTSEDWGALAFMLGNDLGIDVEADAKAAIESTFADFDKDAEASAGKLVKQSKECDEVYASIKAKK